MRRFSVLFVVTVALLDAVVLSAGVSLAAERSLASRSRHLHAVAAPVAPLVPPPPPTTTTTTAPPPVTVTTSPPPPPPPPPPPRRDIGAYRGLGAWVDVFDFSPELRAAGLAPTVPPATVDEMAADGVQTLYLQAARQDTRTPQDLVDAALTGQFLVRAHARGMRVVAWYAPRFNDVDADLRHLLALREFRVAGQRFDGIALDIEWRGDVPDTATRNARLLELSRRLRAAAPDVALGAIVLTPVHLEVVNPGFWPQFPWRDLAPLYDVWLPMDYWTDRTTASGYRDAFRYTDENIRRLRADLGLPGAAVHVIGGLGDTSTADDYRRFLHAASAQHAVGVSVYNFSIMPASAWGVLRHGRR